MVLLFGIFGLVAVVVFMVIMLGNHDPIGIDDLHDSLEEISPEEGEEGDDVS